MSQPISQSIHPIHPIGHMLIGPPGAGKSTLARAWIVAHPDCVWVSTDRIRQQFYGNEAIQGAWPQVERRVLHQIRKALGAGQSVIYDATNVRRSWRVDLLQKLQDSQTPWIGWHFQVALADCLTQNQRRIRQVPKGVIEEAFDQLHHYPPEPREGFTAVYPVPMVAGQPDLQQMQRLYRSIRNEDSRG